MCFIKCLIIQLCLVGIVPCQGVNLKQIALSEHNNYRRQEGASNMQKMEWSSSLASDAASWISRCQFAHENKGPGENLYMITKGFSDDESEIRGGIKSWYDEKQLYNYGDPFSPSTGHYTQLVWAETNKVGCATRTCPGTGRPFLYLACFYLPRGNTGGTPYERGTACSLCPKTCDGGLCTGPANDGGSTDNANDDPWGTTWQDNGGGNTWDDDNWGGEWDDWGNDDNWWDNGGDSWDDGWGNNDNWWDGEGDSWDDWGNNDDWWDDSGDSWDDWGNNDQSWDNGGDSWDDWGNNDNWWDDSGDSWDDWGNSDNWWDNEGNSWDDWGNNDDSWDNGGNSWDDWGNNDDSWDNGGNSWDDWGNNDNWWDDGGDTRDNSWNNGGSWDDWNWWKKREIRNNGNKTHGSRRGSQYISDSSKSNKWSDEHSKLNDADRYRHGIGHKPGNVVKDTKGGKLQHVRLTTKQSNPLTKHNMVLRNGHKIRMHVSNPLRKRHVDRHQYAKQPHNRMHQIYRKSFRNEHRNPNNLAKPVNKRASKKQLAAKRFVRMLKALNERQGKSVPNDQKAKLVRMIRNFRRKQGDSTGKKQNTPLVRMIGADHKKETQSTAKKLKESLGMGNGAAPNMESAKKPLTSPFVRMLKSLGQKQVKSNGKSQPEPNVIENLKQKRSEPNVKDQKSPFVRLLQKLKQNKKESKDME